ncbi:thiol-dependent ubiquitinyl hydrolase activity protein [[Candida] boidinii]|nr:thiol-dependent ubiquitinyl hydrolase activity protein [[Candida] boidinii]
MPISSSPSSLPTITHHNTVKSLVELGELSDEILSTYKSENVKTFDQYLIKVLACCEEYKKSTVSNNLQEIYIYYTTASRILTEVIPNLPDYNYLVANQIKDDKIRIYDELIELLNNQRDDYLSVEKKLKIISNNNNNNNTNMKDIKINANSNSNDDPILKRFQSLKLSTTSSSSAETSLSTAETSPSTSPRPSQIEIDKFFNKFNNRSVILVEELDQLFDSYIDLVLIIDLRRKKEFDYQHFALENLNLIQIEPVSIRSNYSCHDLEIFSLSTNTDNERDLFSKRCDFELIIVLGSDSTIDNFTNIATKRFIDILNSNSNGKKLKKSPVLLQGGFKEWLNYESNLLNTNNNTNNHDHGVIISPIDSAKPIYGIKRRDSSNGKNINDIYKQNYSSYKNNSNIANTNNNNTNSNIDLSSSITPNNTGGSRNYIKNFNEYLSNSSPNLLSSPQHHHNHHHHHHHHQQQQQRIMTPPIYSSIPQSQSIPQSNEIHHNLPSLSSNSTYSLSSISSSSSPALPALPRNTTPLQQHNDSNKTSLLTSALNENVVNPEFNRIPHYIDSTTNNGSGFSPNTTPQFQNNNGRLSSNMNFSPSLPPIPTAAKLPSSTTSASATNIATNYIQPSNMNNNMNRLINSSTPPTRFIPKQYSANSSIDLYNTNGNSSNSSNGGNSMIKSLPLTATNNNINSNSNNSTLTINNSNINGVNKIDLSSNNSEFQKSLYVMTGLTNLGNSCYMNCILQCLAGTTKLVEFFIKGDYKKHININSKLGSKGILASEFANLLLDIYMKSNKYKPTYISPIRFRKIIASLNSVYRTTEQQDCSEFLNYILDSLHEDLNENGNKLKLPDLTKEEELKREKLPIRYASTIEWERYLKTNFSIIVDIFQGQYLSQLKCFECETTSTTYTSFSTLTLPIPDHINANSINLEQCFDDFVKSEVLDGDDRWLCPRCKKKVKALKITKISRLPEVLIIILKRFKMDSYLTKINNFINYPKILKLDKYWPKIKDENERLKLSGLPLRGQLPPFNYSLFGVVNHFGGLLTGHYTSYVYKGSDYGWCYFDDDKITKRCNDSKVINSNAYVLFYSRI